MTKLKTPLLSLGARGRLTSLFSFAKRRGRHIIERKPTPTDAKSTSQLFNRHMFNKCVDLWHLLSEAEKQTWESAARPLHMAGYPWYISQCLRPNPGIYLPLQGGTMAGIIDMDGFEITDLPDPVNPQDADTEAARDAAIAAALEDCIDSHIHGWDGEDWQKLKVESTTQHNLRVGLFAGSTQASIAVYGGTFPTSRKALHTSATLYAYDGINYRRVSYEQVNFDNLPTTRYSLPAQTFLYGFDDSNWDRLRTYGTGILKVGRAEIGLSTLRRVGAGQVKASPGTLYWITMNPTAANSIIELTDDVDGLSAVVWDMTHGANAAHHMNLDPPMEFSAGIYLKTLTNFTSVIFGYK